MRAFLGGSQKFKKRRPCANELNSGAGESQSGIAAIKIVARQPA